MTTNMAVVEVYIENKDMQLISRQPTQLGVITYTVKPAMRP